MKMITASKLRETLFPSLKSAALGDSLLVSTKAGPVLITSATKKKIRQGEGARIQGSIVSDLDEAQDDLREHLKWPR